ncbi:flagellum-specific ATP synthase FliI, partial [Pseudomonadales bacterium]|nr:flagellum-specific ATP synthase FliI [Pseudomonadales bacterium]MDB4363329.1 flagellum-specific ATP synthase FliI [Pseudomonadales bacterium]
GNGGSVTGLYTVLTEGDDMNDPVADSARAILDGHVVLSRRIAAEGIYPAVDIQASISRSMQQIVSSEQWTLANRLNQLIARYAESKDLISVGAYTPGIDALTDQAIQKQTAIREFLRQSLDDAVDLSESFSALQNLIDSPAAVDGGEVQDPRVVR